MSSRTIGRLAREASEMAHTEGTRSVPFRRRKHFVNGSVFDARTLRRRASTAGLAAMAAEALAVTIGSVDSKGKERERGASPLATESVRLCREGSQNFQGFGFLDIGCFIWTPFRPSFHESRENVAQDLSQRWGTVPTSVSCEILVSKNVRHPSRASPPSREPLHAP